MSPTADNTPKNTALAPAPPLSVLYVEDDGLTAHNTLAGIGAETDVRHCRAWAEAEALAERHDFDVAVVDVHLAGSPLDGIDVGHVLHARHRLPIVVTTGASDERTLARLEALPHAQYLLKPFSPAQLRACLRRASRLAPPPTAFAAAAPPPRSHLAKTLAHAHFLKAGRHRLERVDYLAIDYLAADGAYTDVVLQNGRRRTVDRGLRATLRLFGRDDLLQVHKSYAVPAHAIKSVSAESVVLRTGHELPLGRTYRKRVFAALTAPHETSVA